MGGPAARLLLRHSREGLRNISWQPLTRSVSSLTNADFHEPSASELVRFILTASGGSNTELGANTDLRERSLQLIDAEWKLGAPPPALWYALKGVYPTSRAEEAAHLQWVSDLSALTKVVERLVVNSEGANYLQMDNCKLLWAALQRCQVHSTYAEIASAINDVAARLERLKLPLRPQLFDLGMYYAALSLSVSALGNFLGSHQKLNSRQLSPEAGSRIVEALHVAVDSAIFENPSYDTGALLAEMTGEGSFTSSSPSWWHDMFDRALRSNPKSFALYLSLLSTLQSNAALRESWGNFLNLYDPKDRAVCHSAYSVVVSLIHSRRSETALAFLEDISTRSNDDLPYIASFKSFKELLKDPLISEALPDFVGDDNYQNLIKACFENMEQRLGIRWQDTERGSESDAHYSVSSGSPWTVFKEQPLFTIDGECAGYDDVSRLYPELEAHGCSKSPSELSQIVELLHEHDGNPQGVTVQPVDNKQWTSLRTKFPYLEFRWCAQHSPIEFSNSKLPTSTDQHMKWTPVSLGLIRARSMVKEVPQRGLRCLHLMQLGSLEMRHGTHEPWQSTGYIVTWDRQFGELVALFVGTSAGVFDPGLAPVNAPFGPAMHIRPSDLPNVLYSGPDPYLRVLTDPYFLDIDPSPDLSL
ncbi:uncharacterized protein N7459_003982 [Penicillium hispanicum]|uniref:uncharacterized protein n=1 Tax=Penicillium hispanicum TaxID=1080232 RepID=UPI0025420980|nr:uncharacterized protein N7459_003982 [Penicillium hispanicum]KAJ5584182.1 hypothetical protein N7459_003982 [Penicillium hispanicum]